MCMGVMQWMTGCPPLPTVKLMPLVEVATPICPGGVRPSMVSVPVNASDTPILVKNGAGPCTAPEYQVPPEGVQTGALAGAKLMPSADVATPIPDWTVV